MLSGAGVNWRTGASAIRMGGGFTLTRAFLNNPQAYLKYL
jgi:hypothetical protein